MFYSISLFSTSTYLNIQKIVCYKNGLIFYRFCCWLFALLVGRRTNVHPRNWLLPRFSGTHPPCEEILEHAAGDASVFDSIFLGPFTCIAYGLGLIDLPQLGHIVG